MNRKDTIIVAVLINAALLTALFITAVKKEPAATEHTLAVENKPFAEKTFEFPKPSFELKATGGDEVDAVLQQLSIPAPSMSATPSMQPESSRPEPVSAPSSNPFIDDLRALSQSSNSSHAATQSFGFSSEASELIDVTVKKGDALEKIARAHHTSVDEIKKLNQLKGNNLKIGQVLKVKSGSKNGKKQEFTEAAQQPTKYYVVKNGDNPWTIAVKNHMKVDELLKLNELDEEKARRLKPGDKLVIR